MIRFFEDRKIGSEFLAADGADAIRQIGRTVNHLKFVWNRGPETAAVQVDDMAVSLLPGHMLCSTYVQRLGIGSTGTEAGLRLLAFSRAFYCIHTNDKEVSCNGLLFFGSDYTPVITVDEAEELRLNTLWEVLGEEFGTVDRNQDEMLRILLKRFIIRATRLARRQLVKTELPAAQLDLLRAFNVLVEEHFRSRRQVADYAALLHRSPKTITNLFSLHSGKSPLQIIHDRIALEARRLLLYTGKSSKEIAHDLGFEDPAQFSRFFKKQMGVTAQAFRETHRAG